MTPTPIEITSVASLRERLGQEVAVSDWLDVTQERIRSATGFFDSSSRR